MPKKRAEQVFGNLWNSLEFRPFSSDFIHKSWIAFESSITVNQPDTTNWTEFRILGAADEQVTLGCCWPKRIVNIEF